MSKFKRSASEKLYAIQTYEEGVSTLWEVARLFGVTQSTLLRWRQMY
ncbi:helix-turn-helix domain-containing protein, partial [Exiguobacterium sp. H66]